MSCFVSWFFIFVFLSILSSSSLSFDSWFFSHFSLFASSIPSTQRETMLRSSSFTHSLLILSYSRSSVVSDDRIIFVTYHLLSSLSIVLFIIVIILATSSKATPHHSSRINKFLANRGQSFDFFLQLIKASNNSLNETHPCVCVCVCVYIYIYARVCVCIHIKK